MKTFENFNVEKDDKINNNFGQLFSNIGGSNVSVIERSTIKSGIESLNPPLVTLTPTVTQQGNQGNAQIKVSGPWAGIRALGVNVGIRF